MAVLLVQQMQYQCILSVSGVSLIQRSDGIYYWYYLGLRHQHCCDELVRYKVTISEKEKLKQ